MPTTTHSADQAVDDLRQFVSKGEYGLDAVPSLIKEIIRKGYWKERIVQASGATVTFKTFEQFLAKAPPDGVGSDVATIKRLCVADKDALTALDDVLGHNQGRRTDLVDNINEVRAGRPDGTSAQQSLRRLAKDRSDLHARVVAGELSPHAAMVEAGFRRRTLSVEPSPKALNRFLRRHLTRQQIEELVGLLGEER